MDNIFFHCFLPLINRPSRITVHSVSLIDNILTNHLPNNSKSGILFTDISDHLAVFTLLPESEDYITNQLTNILVGSLSIRRPMRNINVNWSITTGIISTELNSQKKHIIILLKLFNNYSTSARWI